MNGVDVTDRTDIASTGTLTSINPTNIEIGSDQPFSEYLNGTVDEVRFYTRLLTSAEVVTDMNTPLGASGRHIAPAVQLSNKQQQDVIESRSFAVTITPNPTVGYFNLVAVTNDKNPVTVRVLDISGRVMETYGKVNANAIIQIGQTLSTGTYFAEVITGGQRKVVKIVKLK